MVRVVFILAAASVAAGCGDGPAPPPPQSQPAAPQHVEELQAPPAADANGPAVDADATAAGNRARPRPTDPRLAALLREGDLALAGGDARAAITAFNRAMAIDPTQGDALRGLATALVADSQHRRALPIFRMITALTPQDRTALFNLGVTFMRLKQYDDAETAFKQLIDTDAGDVRAWYNLATLHADQGKLPQAAADLRTVVRLNGEMVTAHQALGQILMDLDQPHEAMTAFAEVAKRQPKSLEALHNLSVAAEAAGSYGRAIAAAEQAAELAGNNPGFWLRAGELNATVYERTQHVARLRAAIDAWQKSLDINKDQPDLQRAIRRYRLLLPQATPATQPNGSTP